MCVPLLIFVSIFNLNNNTYLLLYKNDIIFGPIAKGNFSLQGKTIRFIIVLVQYSPCQLDVHTYLRTVIFITTWHNLYIRELDIPVIKISFITKMFFLTDSTEL